MTLVLYYAPFSNATPVAWALAELGVQHEKQRVDLKAEGHKKPEFLQVNPHGKVPTAVLEGVPLFGPMPSAREGAPLWPDPSARDVDVLDALGSETLAIVLWAADRYGAERGLWPTADDPRRLVALAWSTWAYEKLGGALTRVFAAVGGKRAAYGVLGGRGVELQYPEQSEAAKKEIEFLYEILDARLGGQDYVLGPSFSIADLLISSAVGFSAFSGIKLDAHPTIVAWLRRCQSRPAFKSTILE